MTEHAPHAPEESLARARRVDAACLRFEAAWRVGDRPRAEEYLADADPADRPDLFRELLTLELALRRHAGDEPAWTEFQHRFPDDLPVVEQVWREATSLPVAPPSRLEGASSVNQSRASASTLEQPLAAGHPTQPRALHAGCLLGDYELAQLLGKGGMGEVYRARQRRANRDVALKLIRQDRLEDLPPADRARWLARFKTEAQAAARVDHPHVLTVYEVGEVDGTPFYTMKYVAGQSLAERAGAGPLPNVQAAALLEKVARAVQHAHACGVVHRDLKPRNILIDAQGQPYVGDFGLAKCLDEAQELTHTGECLGTASYMAPEQTDDAVHATAASDVYGLGATLYTLVTGRPPFRAASHAETLYQVRYTEPVRPRRLNPTVDADLETIVLKCLEKEPARRYTTAGELAEDLQRYVERRPILARPVGRVARTVRWCRRNRALAGAIGATSIAVLAGLFLLAAYLRHSIDARERNRQARRKEAESLLDAGLRKCEEGYVGDGMLTFVRALDLLPSSEHDLDDVIRLNLALWREQVCRLHNILPQDGAVKDVSFSPSGSELLVLGQAPDVPVWETATGKLRGSLRGHSSTVDVAAYSPDGTLIVTGSRDSTARLWNANDSACRATLKAASRITTVSWASNGRLLAVGTSKGGIHLVAPQTGREMFPVLDQGGMLESLAFSPDGCFLLAASENGLVKLWDCNTGKQQGRSFPHRSSVYHVAFGSVPWTAYTAGQDGAVRLWDLRAGQVIGEPLRLDGPVRRFLLTADRSTAVAVTDAGGAFVCKLPADIFGTFLCWLWRAGGRPPAWRVLGLVFGEPLRHRGKLRAVAFSPDGLTLATGSEDGTVRLWVTHTGKPLAGFQRHAGSVTAIAFDPRGGGLATGCRDARVRLWESNGENGSRRLPGRPWPETRVLAVSPDGRTFMSGGPDGSAWLIRSADGAVLNAHHHSTAVLCASFSPVDGNFLATGGAEGVALLSTTEVAVQPRRRPSRGGWVYALAFSSDGKLLITGEERAARVWDLKSGTLVVAPLIHPAGAQSLALTRDGIRLVTGSFDGVVRVWDLTTGKCITSCRGHTAGVLALAVSPDGHYALSGSDDRTARLWDLESGRQIGPPVTHEGMVHAVAFRADGRYAASASVDGKVRFWDLAIARCTELQPACAGGIVLVRFDSEGKTLVAATDRGELRHWDVASTWPLGPPASLGLPGTEPLWKFRPSLWSKETDARQWTEVAAGISLDESGETRLLDDQSWREARNRGRVPLPGLD